MITLQFIPYFYNCRLIIEDKDLDLSHINISSNSISSEVFLLEIYLEIVDSFILVNKRLVIFIEGLTDVHQCSDFILQELNILVDIEDDFNLSSAYICNV